MFKSWNTFKRVAGQYSHYFIDRNYEKQVVRKPVIFKLQKKGKKRRAFMIEFDRIRRVDYQLTVYLLKQNGHKIED